MTSADDDLRDVFLRELAGHGVGEGEAMEALAESLEPIAPPEALRARILASARGPGRLHRFAADIARLLDVATDKAKAFLDGIDDAANFGESPVPGVGLYHVSGGAKVANCITGFIRMAPGAEFPHHRHEGEEQIYVVQGSLEDSDGNVFGPGELSVMPPGSEHSFTVREGPTLVYLAIVATGITVGGETFEPGDPRI